MSSHDRPLPKPPKTPFGTARPSSEQGPAGLLSDRMAEAAVQGKLDEFLRSELPDSEEARTLAKMMMGMSGMMLPEGMTEMKTLQQPSTGADDPAAAIPADVFKAVQGGDVKGLVDLLRKEHQKRSPGGQTAVAGEAAPPEGTAAQPAGQPVIDKELIDALIRIAADNSVTLDWIILRAVKVYVEEHARTGKL